MTGSSAVTALTMAPGVPGTRMMGTGSFQPERIVTNDDLAKVMDTTDEWIRDRVGIVERRAAEPEDRVIDYAANAGRAALADAGVDGANVDTVIVATCTMPGAVPNAAGRVADMVGANGAGAFDVNAACAGFCYAMATASDLVRGGSSERVLVVGAEIFRDWVEPTDRANAIIFADGAGAAVIGPSDVPAIGPVAWGSSGDQADLIYLRDNKYLYQEGRSVFRWATTQVAPVALRALELTGLKPSDVDVLVPHQANLRIVQAIAKKLRAEGAREDMVVADDIMHSGNTSSASIPMALDHMRAAGRVRGGDVLLLVGFGAGLCYAAQVVICP